MAAAQLRIGDLRAEDEAVSGAVRHLVEEELLAARAPEVARIVAGQLQRAAASAAVGLTRAI